MISINLSQPTIRNTADQDRQLATTKNKPWKVISMVMLGVIASFAIIHIFWAWFNTELVLNSEDLKISTVERGTITREINSIGKIVAANAPIIYSSEAGRVKLFIKPGQRVNKNQLLAEITSVNLPNNLKKQQSQLNSLELEFQRHSLNMKHKLLLLKQKVQQTEVEWLAAKRETNRAKKIIENNLISQQVFERIQDKLLAAELNYQQAKQSVVIQQESLEFENQVKAHQVDYQQLIVNETKQRVKNLHVHSPVDGMLGNWLVEQGAQLDVNQALMTVIDLTEYEAELAISESFIDELALSMPVKLSASGQQLTGNISLISPEVKNNSVVARVQLKDSTAVELRQNQRLTATIKLEEKADVLMVRRGAFIQSSGGKWSYRLTGEHAEKVPLTTGISNLTHIEIEAGAKEGDHLVTSSLTPFLDINSVLIR